MSAETRKFQVQRSMAAGNDTVRQGAWSIILETYPRMWQSSDGDDDGLNEGRTGPVTGFDVY